MVTLISLNTWSNRRGMAFPNLSGNLHQILPIALKLSPLFSNADSCIWAIERCDLRFCFTYLYLLVSFGCKYTYSLCFVDNSTFLSCQLSIRLEFFFIFWSATHVYRMVCFYAYSSCIQDCNAQKQYNHNQNLRVKYC